MHPQGRRVISLEPQPELGDFLLNLKKSFDPDKAAIANKGLSGKEGTFDIFRKFAGSGGAISVFEGGW